MTCKYPGCVQSHTMTWALVPLCEEHWLEIHRETLHYYKNRLPRDERISLKQIEHLTPWRRSR